jgi:hypothetical protein
VWKFSLSPEQAMVFADEDGQFFMAGFFDIATGLFQDMPGIIKAFRTNGAMAWHGLAPIGNQTRHPSGRYCRHEADMR